MITRHDMHTNALIMKHNANNSLITQYTVTNIMLINTGVDPNMTLT